MNNIKNLYHKLCKSETEKNFVLIYILTYGSNLNMGSNISILTARVIRDEKWRKYTQNIFNFYPLVDKKNLLPFIKKQIIKVYTYINKFDTGIGLRLFLHRGKYDVLISNTIKQAMVFSFLCMIFGKKKNIHILNEIYFHDPVCFKHKLRPAIFKLFAKNVDFFRTSSKKEIINYSKLLNIDKNRFWFLHLSTPVLEPEIVTTDENYILSAGKQYRDYETLVSAIKGTNLKLIIVSDPDSMRNVKTCGEIKVYKNIPKNRYLELLRKSSFVVVPLNNDFSSCGQISILEGMSYGKPVITTKVAATIDYIRDGESGLFYEMGNSEDLKNKILMLNTNKELQKKLVEEAFNSVLVSFTQHIFVERYLDFIQSIFHSHKKQHR